MRKGSLPDRFASTPALVAAYSALNADTINSWVRQGRIKTDSQGKRSEQDCLNLLHTNFLMEVQRLKGQKGECDLKEEMDRARLRKILLEGDLIEIEKESKLEELVRRDEAIAELDDAFAKVRSKLLTLPNRLALEISGIKDPNDIKARLEDVVRESLDELNHSLIGEDEPS